MANVKVNITASQIIAGLRISPSALLEMSDFWVKRVQGFTRSGKSLVTNDRIKALSAPYVARRRSYRGSTGQAFSPTKSNLTLTGQLLESVKGSANVRLQRVQLACVGSRSGESLTNARLAGYVAEQGRPFLGLDDKGRARMVQIVLRDLRRTLRKRRRS